MLYTYTYMCICMCIHCIHIVCIICMYYIHTVCIIYILSVLYTYCVCIYMCMYIYMILGRFFMILNDLGPKNVTNIVPRSPKTAQDRPQNIKYIYIIGTHIYICTCISKYDHKRKT